MVARAVFDQSVIPEGRFAVALSGGGDSTALVHMLRGAGPLVLIVDHGLREGSAEEASRAKAFAESLGLEARILTWAHDNPKTAIQEKARKARYALMGEACRAAGISHLLTGHTEDDQAETLLMRYERNTGWRGAAGMAARTYAPLWPELAMVTVVRSLLSVTRRALRDYNHRHGLIWIEDPSNENRDFTRIRARDFLRRRPHMRQNLLDAAAELRAGTEQERARFRAFATRHVRVDMGGIIHCGALPPPHLLGILLQCASGTGRSIQRESVKLLHNDMRRSDFRPGTLSGALVVKTDAGFEIGRDPVAAKGRANQAPVPVIELAPGASMIWDGRFHIRAGDRPEMIATQYSLARMQDERSKGLGTFDMSHPAALRAPDQTQIISVVAQRLHKMLGT